MKYIVSLLIGLLFCSLASATTTRKNIDRWTGGWIAIDANSVITYEKGVWVFHLPNIDTIYSTTGDGGTTKLYVPTMNWTGIVWNLGDGNYIDANLGNLTTLGVATALDVNATFVKLSSPNDINLPSLVSPPASTKLTFALDINLYGTDTNLLGKPTKWADVNVGGTMYAVPCYTKP
jgi:hypothetical protein